MILANVLHVAAELNADIAAFLAPAWRELAACGVRQTLLHAGPADGLPAELRAAPTPVRLIALDLDAQAGRWAYVRALRAALHVELASHAYQAVHLHGAKAGLAGRLVLPTLAERPPVFHSPHGLSGLDRDHTLADTLVALGERAPGLGDLLPVSCSQAEARRLERLTGRAPVLLCPPVDERFFALRRGGGSRPPQVVGLGHAAAPQAPDQFAELAARFHFAGEPARFIWLGSAETHYEQLLRAAGVTVTGALAADEADALLADADVVVQTGRGYGAPLAIVQAMAAAAPLVAIDLAGHRDLLQHDRTGLLAEDLAGLARQVKALLDDPARATALGAAAREDARQRFHPDRFRASLLDLYRLHERVAPQGVPASTVPAPAPAPTFDPAAP